MDYEKKIREYLNSSEVDQLYKSMLKNLFPKLAESDDERIRTLIISSIKNDMTVGSTKNKEECIAWLEKHVEWTGLLKREDGESACSLIERSLTPADRKVWYEACDEIKKRNVQNPKPAEWSRKETEIQGKILFCLKSMVFPSTEEREKMIEWLKTLPERCEEYCKFSKKKVTVFDDLDKDAKAYARVERSDDTEVGYDLNKYCGYIEGALRQKRKMLKDAMETEVKVDAGGYPYIEVHIELYDYDNDKPLAKVGDKVKVITIKSNRL